ncbi:hypothetical protein [Cellulosilyticum ruminicola]|uniref:hypothetical protein n=1 Tax=Cellulosilyticum ruminicola TaxID=425254 RepID=UPI0006D19763|nr:hypothetical protein [Cellulosilyticum ruminicola]
MKISSTNKLYHYKMYGLHITSEIELSDLITAPQEGISDVKIIYDVMPEMIKKAQEQNIHYDFKPHEMWFEVEDLCTFYIQDGHLIKIINSHGKDEQLIKGHLFGNAFACLLAQRQQIAIHGGTIVINEQAVIITGDSGAGKSTLTTALRQRGFKFLADDVSALNCTDPNNSLVEPTFPYQKLCTDVMHQMGYNLDSYLKIDEEREKYLIPVGDSFLNEAVRLGGIVEISIGMQQNIHFQEAKGHEKLTILLKNIYRQSIWQLLPMPSSYFKQCLNLLKQVPIYTLQRPAAQDTLTEEVDIVIRLFQNCCDLSENKL